MDDRTQGALLLAVGGIALRLGFTDVALSYVKAGMQPLLVAAGLVLVALGAQALWHAFRSAEEDTATVPDHAALHGYAALDPETEEPAADAHAHAHAPTSAWLLVLPLLALLLIAPPALGAFAAERQSTRPPVTTQTAYPPLPDAVDGAVELSLLEFTFRAIYDDDRSLDGERVRMSGFVTSSDDAQTYLLTRFRLQCCAADATAITVEIAGDRQWPEDTWLEVEGYWEPRPDGDPQVVLTKPPMLRAERAHEIDPPSQPYEY